jgi:hypothetical protein
VDLVSNGTTLFSAAKDGLALAYAISTYGFDFPAGTTSEFAFEAVNSTALSPSATVYATVDAFYPSASCEVVAANWTFGFFSTTPNGTFSNPGVQVEISSPDCYYQSANMYGGDIPGLTIYSLQSGLCLGEGQYNSSTRQFAVFAGAMTVSALHMTVAEAQFSPFEANNLLSEGMEYFAAVPSQIQATNSSAVLCTIDTEIRQASVTTTRNATQAVLNSYENTTHNLNQSLSSTWAFEINGAFVLGSDLFGGVMSPVLGTASGPYDSLGQWSGRSISLFKLMNTTDPQKTVDGNFLKRATPKVLNMIMA